MGELPPLTPEEQSAIDSIDMTKILGSWKEQYQNAYDVAIKYMRRCRQQQAEIERLTKDRDEARHELQRAHAQWLTLEWVKSRNDVIVTSDMTVDAEMAAAVNTILRLRNELKATAAKPPTEAKGGGE